MADPRRGKQTEKAVRRGAAPLHVPPESEDTAETVDREDEEKMEESSGQFRSELETLRKERDDLRDRLQRLAAEFDNYRKRQARDFSRLVEQGRKKMLEELIPVLDNFDRARKVCEGEHSDKEIVEGVMQTSDQLINVLEKEGLEEVPTKPGDPFDPNIHEAMAAEPIEEGSVDTVLEVYQKGYIYGSDLLRPVRVKVGKVPSGNGD